MTTYFSEVVTSIQDISHDEWNNVIAKAPTIRHEVLELEEFNTSNSNRARFFLLRDENKCLQAVSIAIHTDNDSEYGAEGLVLGRFARRFRIFKNLFRPAIICGLLGHGSPVYVKSSENQTLWIRRILVEMEAYANKNNHEVGFISVLPEQLVLMKELTARGYYRARGLPEAKVEITWNDEITYLQTLRAKNKKYYKTAKREINKFRQSGISVSEWDGSNAKEILNLIKKHHNEKNKVQLGMLPEYLNKLKCKLGDDCKIYLARRKSELLGVIILLKKDEIAWAWKIGIDHALDGNNFTYFNLAYYYLLSKAPALNLNTIWYGNAALYAKIRRGCSVDFTHFYYKPIGFHRKLMIYILLAFQRFWYQKKFSSFIEMGK